MKSWKKSKIEAPRLFIPEKPWRKLLHYTRAVGTEISGFAEVDWDANQKELVVGEIYLLDQEVNQGHTELDEKAVDKFLFNYIKKGGTQLPRLWWHTHNDFGVFFSAEDEGTIERLNKDSFLVALCLNKKGDTHAGLYLHKPVELVVEPMEVYPEEGKEDIPKAILAEVKKKVKREKPIYVPPKGKLFGFEERVNQENAFLDEYLVEYLPRNQNKRKRFIKKNKLYIAYDYELGMYVFKSQKRKEVWVEHDGGPAFGELQTHY